MSHDRKCHVAQCKCDLVAACQCDFIAEVRADERKRIAQEVRDNANFIAAEVRRADGKHTMGAGALGETLAESIAARIARGGEDDE